MSDPHFHNYKTEKNIMDDASLIPDVYIPNPKQKLVDDI